MRPQEVDLQALLFAEGYMISAVWNKICCLNPIYFCMQVNPLSMSQRSSTLDQGSIENRSFRC